MTYREVLSKVDHTLLKQQATWEQIKQICDDAAAFGTASICIPPSYVKACAEYLDGKVPVCTVIGFPNGYNTTAVKVFETQEAVKEGAEEIDMVINIGWVKDGRYDLILEEINAIKEACNGKLLKVIIETCELTDDEKKQMCKVVTESGAEYIKTSTGFGKTGATPQDVAILKGNVGKKVKVKASGGIDSLQDADLFMTLGASRLGTSKLVGLFKKMK